MTTRHSLITAALLGLLAAGPSAGQTGAGSGPTAEPLVALPPEKQALIRDHVRRSNLPAADLSEPARVDMIVPPDVDLLVLPQDAGTEVPTTTSYKFLIAGDVIAIVEPESRKVIQLIGR